MIQNLLRVQVKLPTRVAVSSEISAVEEKKLNRPASKPPHMVTDMPQSLTM